MGYSFLLMKAGRVVAEGAGGLARNAADGEMKMTTSTPQNLGSLMKFITGVAVLNMLDKPPAGSAGGNNSFETRLNAPIALLWPQDWMQASTTSPDIRRITFREVLGHRSGLRSCDGPIDCLAAPYSRANLGRSYQNINFSWLGYMIPLYLEPSLRKSFDDLRAKKAMTADKRANNIDLVLGNRMMTHINGSLFDQVTGRIALSCDAANAFKTTGAYGYRSKSDRSKGNITSRQAEGKPCSGAGGNWISVRDFGAFTATALYTDRMLSRAAKDAMFRPGLEADDRLVWSFTMSDSWTRDRFGMDPIIWSNGIQPYSGGQSFNTVLLRLPQEYHLMLFANSGGMNVNALARAGLDAWRAGVEAGN